MTTISKTNWADEIGEEEDRYQSSTYTDENGLTVVIEYRENEDGKKVKITRKIQKILKKEKVNHAVAERKKWAKFGDEKGNKPGPDTRTTSVGEVINLKLALNVAGENNEEDPDAKLKESLKGRKILCRICKGDHFTTKCPYKDTLQPMDEIAASPGTTKPASPAEPNTTGKYIPAHRRANPTATATDSPRDRRDDSITLRVTNISEDARESDIHALFRKFGQLTRVFVAKDHDTGLCKGYAFVSFDRRDDAQKALEHLNGFGYDNLILRVEWAK